MVCLQICSFSFFENEAQAKNAAEKVKMFMKSEGLDCDLEVTRVDNQGARIL